MTIVAEQHRNVIGVDTHARTHTYVSIDAITGRVVAQETFPTSPPGIRRAISWMDRVSTGPFLAAVEGASTYGSLLCTALRDAGIPLTEARPPKRSERRAGKSDAIDAEAAARDALGQQLERLIEPRMGTQRAALRVLLAARRNIEQHNAADRCALTALVRTVDLHVDARHRLTAGQIKTIAGWRHHIGDDVERQVARVEASRLARSVIALGVELRANKQQLRGAGRGDCAGVAGACRDWPGLQRGVPRRVVTPRQGPFRGSVRKLGRRLSDPSLQRQHDPLPAEPAR